MTCFGVVIGLLCALDEREGNVGCGEGPSFLLVQTYMSVVWLATEAWFLAGRC